MIDGKFTKRLLNILLVFLIILVGSKIKYIFNDSLSTLGMLVQSLIISLFIYYWLRPVVTKLTNRFGEGKKGMLAGLSILLMILLIIVLISSVGVVVASQFKEVFLESGQDLNVYLDKIMENLSKLNINKDFMKNIYTFLENLTNNIGEKLFSAFSSVGSFTTQLVLIPFIAFYLLKDDKKIVDKLKAIASQKGRDDLISFGVRADGILSNYIVGQLFVAFIIGSLMTIGYLILGVPNAILMGSIAMITSVIPIIGAFLGVIPAIFMALTVDLFLAVKIGILAVIVQQLEGNLITPRFMGSRLNVHPLTLMIIIIVSINIMGIFGAFIGVPLYLLLNIIVKELVLKKYDLKL